MSIRINGPYTYENNTTLATKTLNGNAEVSSGSYESPLSWKRNPAWLPMTAPLESEQKFVGLHAVWPDSNFLGISASGNYTVDWGDGTAPQNVNSGVVAFKTYDYTNASLAGTDRPVTFQDSTNTVTRTAHGYVNGDTVKFYNIVTTTGISEETPYYVIDASTDTFKVSTEPSGTEVNLVNDGSGTLLPYKQVIVQVYPQAGQNLTQLNLHQKHSQTNLQLYTSGFLDIAVSGENLTDIRIGTPSANASSTMSFNMLEQANIVRSDCRQLGFLFYNCGSLRNIVNLNTSTSPSVVMSVTFTDATDTITATNHGFRNGDSVLFTSITSTQNITTNNRYFVVSATQDTFKIANTYGGLAASFTTDGTGVAVRGTDMIGMFTNCYSLTSVPLFNTSSVTNMANMFSNCNSLTTVPLFDTSVVRNMSLMFTNCFALQSVPLFNTELVITMQSMFSSCYALESVPLFNTSEVRTMSFMFQNCYALITVPLFNTASVTTMASMFSSCYALESVPLFNTASVTNMSSMFSSCYSLITVPLFNTAAVTTMASMFATCYVLQSVPLFNTAIVTDMSAMFINCRCLITVPLFNTASVTTMATMFQNCYALITVPLFDTALVTNMASMFLNCYALQSVPLFNTASVTTMASMFSGCRFLVSVPLFNTASVANMSGMFTNCYSLTSVPLFNTAAVTNMSSMFSSCYALASVPLFNTAAVTTMNGMFNGCSNLTTVPALVTTAVTSSTNFTNMFFSCPSLSSIKAKNFRFTFTVGNCKLSSTALNEIYTNLPTVTGQTITVSGNYGTTGDTPSIATAKGWTVSG